MKAKKFDKKLSLKKETISNLNGESLSALKGGASAPFCMKLTEKCFIQTFIVCISANNICNKTKLDDCLRPSVAVSCSGYGL